MIKKRESADCTRYAMKREVAAQRGREFPLSMSDYQTGRQNKLIGLLSGLSVLYFLVECIGWTGCKYAVKSFALGGLLTAFMVPKAISVFRLSWLRFSLTFFMMCGRNTRHSVQYLSLSRRKNSRRR